MPAEAQPSAAAAETNGKPAGPVAAGLDGGAPAPGEEPLLNILVLADRDWTHPQGGGTGLNVYAQVVRWARWGHRVTVVAGEYPGSSRYEEVEPNLVVHRMGGRGSVFPRAILAVMRGLGRDADVVLEVINGITFLTPLWLRKPRVALVNHPHRDLYTGEFGPRVGRVLAAVFEELPLRHLYRRAPFLTISNSARDELVTIDGVPPEHITVCYCGVGPGPLRPRERAPEPRLLYLGRLKAYKRVEHVLDVLEAIPGATLDIAGAGDHGDPLGAEVARRGLSQRVRLHGRVDEETKARLLGEAWVHVTASASEGWSLTVMEAALCDTPSVALAVGGLRESILDGETGFLAHDLEGLTARVRQLIEDAELRERMGAAAGRRARTFTWERTAATNLEVLKTEAATGKPAVATALARSNLRRRARA